MCNLCGLFQFTSCLRGFFFSFFQRFGGCCWRKPPVNSWHTINTPTNPVVSSLHWPHSVRLLRWGRFYALPGHKSVCNLPDVVHCYCFSVSDTHAHTQCQFWRLKSLTQHACSGAVRATPTQKHVFFWKNSTICSWKYWRFIWHQWRVWSAFNKTFCCCSVFFPPLKGGTITIAAAQTENWSFCGATQRKRCRETWNLKRPNSCFGIIGK